MKTLVAIGCSHTAGAELYKGLSDHPKSKALSFASTIAKELDLQYINLAQNGASNDYIFRNTIKFINQNQSSINDYFFLIGWTSAWRFELRYRDDEQYVHNKGQHIIDPKYVPCSPNMWLDNIQESRMKKMVTKFSDILAEPVLTYDKMATYAWSLQQVFKSLKINYHMFNAIHGLPVVSSTKDIIKNIDTKYFHEPQNDSITFYNYCKDTLKIKPNQYYHLPQNAHNEFAKILLQRISL
jgi:hypothetical protein